MEGISFQAFWPPIKCLWWSMAANGIIIVTQNTASNIIEANMQPLPETALALGPDKVHSCDSIILAFLLRLLSLRVCPTIQGKLCLFLHFSSQPVSQSWGLTAIPLVRRFGEQMLQSL